MSKVICIVNQKGGVGKTTTAVNLSASLAAAEKKTLLLDIDPQGNASSGVGIDRRTLDKTIYHSLIGDEDIHNVVRKTDLEYLDVLPSNSDLIGVEIEFVTSEHRESRLKDILTPLEELYDYIIIDCPPSLGLLTVNALKAAKSVLIPVQCEYYALEGLSQLIHTIDLIRLRMNKDLSIEGILLTMFDTRTNLSHQVVTEVNSFFKNKERVFKTIVKRNIKLSESPGYGKPIILYDITSKGAKDYIKLAKEILPNGRKKK
jgi:chromosome partitioning protein